MIMKLFSFSCIMWYCCNHGNTFHNICSITFASSWNNEVGYFVFCFLRCNSILLMFLISFVSGKLADHRNWWRNRPSPFMALYIMCRGVTFIIHRVCTVCFVCVSERWFISMFSKSNMNSFLLYSKEIIAAKIVFYSWRKVSHTESLSPLSVSWIDFTLQ